MIDSFWGNIFNRGGEHRETRDLLKQVPIFERLNVRELAAIERILYRREYAGDEVIFRQGDPGVGMYIVVRGTVSIEYTPTKQVLAELHDGEFFGEIALLNETPRSATARAKTACTLLGFFQPELLGLLESNPRMAVKVLMPLAQIAGQRLIHTDRQLMQLHEEVERLKARQPAVPDAEEAA